MTAAVAISAGTAAVWPQRDPAVPFDPRELSPTPTIHGLSELAATVLERQAVAH